METQFMMDKMNEFFEKISLIPERESSPSMFENFAKGIEYLGKQFDDDTALKGLPIA